MLARTYQYFRWLSLDVSAGAIVLCAFLSSEFYVTYDWPELVCLGLAVFSIYNLDHWQDARKLDNPSSARRAFHKRYAIAILFAVSLAVLIGGCIALSLRNEILWPGLIFSTLAASYLVFSRILRGLKELGIAMAYSGGVTLIVWVQLGVSSNLLLVAIALAMIAWLNLVVFADIERDEDKREGFHSIALLLSHRNVRSLANGLSIAIVFISFFLLNEHIHVAAYFMFCAASLQVILRWEFFRSSERYRIVGDGIFLIPALFIG